MEKLLGFFLCFMFMNAWSQAVSVYTHKQLTLQLSFDTLAEDYDTICEVKTIDVYIAKQKVQTIPVERNIVGCNFTRERRLLFEDINFDGHIDIMLLQFMPLGPNIPYYYWTYDTLSKQFLADTMLAEITSPEFNSTNKLIYSFWRSGCCHHGNTTYEYIDGKITTIRIDEVQSNNPDYPGKIISTTHELVNGEMKLVEQEFEDDPDYSKEDE